MARCTYRNLTTREYLTFAMVLFDIALMVLFAYLLTGCVPFACSSPGPRTNADIVADEYLRTVQIDRKCADGSDASGSGVRIGGDAVLTAAHVVTCDDGKLGSLTVSDEFGNKYIGLVEATSPRDIARLSVVSLPGVPQVTIGAAVLGERDCATFALPERGRRCGEVWPAYAAKDKSETLQGETHIDFVVEHGNSGAPLWTPTGELAAIVINYHWCTGTDENMQVCTGGATSLISRSWLASP